MRAQCDDREAIEHLLRRTQSWLRRYLVSWVGPSDADDVLQEVLVLVYRKLPWLEAPELYRPWVLRIASRAGMRYLERTRRWRDHERSDEALAAIPSAVGEPNATAVQELLGSVPLSPLSLQVLVLHFQEELTLPEIAAILAVPLGTVKSRLAYGLASLRDAHAKKEIP